MGNPVDHFGYFLCITHMLGQAKHDGYIKTNPCDGSLRLAATGRERGILTMDEFRRLFASPDVWEGNIMAMTGNLLAAVTGMRSHEVAGLRGGDIRDGWIYVHDQYDEKYGIRETKTRDIHQIPIPAGVMRLLRSLERGEDDFLFTENGQKPVDQHYFIRKLKKALMGIGITEKEIKKRNIVFHSW